MVAAGRQGDPGESRFYLSLDDELMRLFATGALSWVMGRALPDDEAIEAKMVTKAIERAQTTVEQRNGEIRKNVLKYDEVMNEQRKVIYQRRDQILEGVDLKAAAMEYLAEAVDALIETHCVSVADDEWDLDGLALELKTFWPSDITEAQLDDVRRDRRDVRPRDGRRIGVLREARGRAVARPSCATSSDRSCCASSTSGGASTSRRWTTSRRASTCGPIGSEGSARRVAA